MSTRDFPPWPQFGETEAGAVLEVLRSGKVNYWTGSECREFEGEFARWIGVEHAVSLGNGTQALEAALRALDVGCGDEVVVTPRSFFASAACVVTVGAKPVFADVDRDSQNITAETIEQVITPRTRAVIVVHLAGWPCEMNDIIALARVHDFAVIEDCAQAHGARYRGRMVGSIGDIGAWSFCQDKIISTGGEGGMVTTHDRSLWSAMWAYKDHGKSWEAVYEQTHDLGYKWIHHGFGTNWRMTEISATIGRIQLRSMPEWHGRRAANARCLAGILESCPGLRVPMPPPHMQHAWYRFYAFVQPEVLRAGWDRDRVMAEIQSTGIPCSVGSCSELYLERAFDNTDYRPRIRLPVSKELGETSLAFLVHPTMGDWEMEVTANAITDVMRRAVH